MFDACGLQAIRSTERRVLAFAISGCCYTYELLRKAAYTQIAVVPRCNQSHVCHDSYDEGHKLYDDSYDAFFILRARSSSGAQQVVSNATAPVTGNHMFTQEAWFRAALAPSAYMPHHSFSTPHRALHHREPAEAPWQLPM